MTKSTSARERTSYTLSIPLDGTAIEHTDEDGPVKVVARTASGDVVSTSLDLRGRTAATAVLVFAEHPGAVTVALGPATADDEHILTADTISTRIPSKVWIDTRELTIAPILIGPWYWGWWRRWCRRITVRGKMICPDGSPVPGAQVCAFDVDRWFIWSSEQQVGCATTGPDGSFELTFTWCCGFYPWWWWFRIRPWLLDAELAPLVQKVVDQDGRLRLAPPTLNPSLATFAHVLDRDDLTNADLASLDPKVLDDVRGRLLERLPEAPELEKLAIWPWAPWTPWLDCTPDLVFRATQDCGRGEVVVYAEGLADTRWDVPDELDVVLVANGEACCRPGDPEDDCLIVDAVCSAGLRHVAGNLTAPAAPASVTGYLVTNVDGVDQALDRPFGGSIPVSHNPSDLVGLDYYALEHSVDGGTTWNPLPAGTSAPFTRQWILFPPPPPPASGPPSSGPAPFTPVTVGPYEVYETRRHYEDNTFGDWAPIGRRYWLSENYNLLCRLDSTRLADGLHHFRIVSFTQPSPGTFVKDDKPVLTCDGQTEAGFVLMIDNRVISPIGHDPAHNCGAGIHLCTAEPDTHIENVRINGRTVGPCDTVMDRSGDLEIDLLAHDPDGHLDWFSLTSHYGTSSVVDLLAAGTLVSLDGGPNAANYAAALADPTSPATRPTWPGGRFRLTLKVADAFPEPCCYLLRLEARKRTIESCATDVRNVSEMTLGVGV